MAEFNPNIPDQNAPNLTTRSQGIGRSTIFSDAVGGLARAAEGFLTAKDESIKKDIYEETLAAKQEVQAPFLTVLDAGELEAPQGVKSGTAEVQRLQTAYNRGTIRPAYYHNKLQDIVKSLRAKYPGYNQEIDQTVAAITGVTPANALVTDFYREAAKNASDASTASNRWQSFIMRSDVMEAIAISEASDYFVNPEKYESAAGHRFIMNEVAKVKAFDANVRRIGAQADLQITLGNLDQKGAEQEATKIATAVGNQITSSVLAEDGEIMTKLDQAARGEYKFTPEDIEGMNATVRALKTRVRARFNEEYNRQDENGSSLASYINDDNFRAGAEATALAQIDTLAELVNNGDYGLAGQYAREIKIRTDSDVNRLLGESLGARVVAATKALSGDAAVDRMIANSEAFAAEYDDLMGNIMTILALGGQSPSANENVSEMRHKEVDGNVARASHDKVVAYILDPQASPEQVENAIDYLYGDENFKYLNNFPIDKQSEIFADLTAPAVSERVFALAQGRPGMFEKYTNWSKDAFSRLFYYLGSEVQIGVVNRRNMNLSWDPETSTISLTETRGPGYMGTLGGATIDSTGDPISDTVEPFLNAATKRAVREMNQILIPMARIVELNGGNPSDEMAGQLSSMGVDFDAVKEGPMLDSFFWWLGDTVLEAGGLPERARGLFGLSPVTRYPGERPKSKDTDVPREK